MGTVAYELQLPASSTVHPVFHVSQLKEARGAPPSVLVELPADATGSSAEVILDTRTCRRGANLIQQSLIQWSGLSPELATWENTAELRAKFPRAAAWGQATLQEGRNVTP